MATVHTLEVDGYHVAERLLEGCMFKVIITEDDGDMKIDRIEKPESTPRGVHAEDFFNDVRERVQENLDHLRKYSKAEGRTLSEEFDLWEQESGEPRIDLLNEV